MSKPKQNTPGARPQSAATDRPRLVCPDCGSSELADVAHGYTRTAITFYADGGSEVHDSDEETTDRWLECDDCGADVRYEELVAEPS